MPNIRSTFLVVVVGFLSLALFGCGDGRKTTYTVRGQLLDARRIAGALGPNPFPLSALPVETQ